ncbi:MAG: hypothetical protein ACRD8K_10010 [Nitrososphaeraceae archaeon]
MFQNHDDPQFKNIIDNFILSTSNDNKQLSYVIKNIDYQAIKLGISFYQMIFILIQKNSYEHRKEEKRNG